MNNTQTAFVYCIGCSKYHATESVKMVDVHEDIFGCDAMVFTCPECKETHESQVILSYSDLERN